MTAWTVYPRRGIAVTAALLLGVSACFGGPSDAPHASDETASASPGPSADAGTADDAERLELSTSGAEVRLELSPLPLVAGVVDLDISVDGHPDLGLPVTLDLVSPDMPMHGVLRYASEVVGPGAYAARIEVPMEGYWELYVNLDYGADAAVFALDVAPGDQGSSHGHGASDDVSAGDHEHGPTS